MFEGNSWIMLVVLGVVFVLMIVMTIVPQKKRQKQQQQMMNNLAVGTKVMTIGRMVGTIVAVNAADNQLILNVGSEENPTLITIDRQAVGVVLNPINAPAAAPTVETTQDAQPEEDEVIVVSEDVVEIDAPQEGSDEE